MSNIIINPTGNGDEPMPPLNHELDLRPEQSLDDKNEVQEYFKMLLSKGYIPVQAVLEITNGFRKMNAPLNWTQAQRKAIGIANNINADRMLRLVECCPFGMLEVVTALEKGDGEGALAAYKIYQQNCLDMAKHLKELHASPDSTPNTDSKG